MILYLVITILDQILKPTIKYTVRKSHFMLLVAFIMLNYCKPFTMSKHLNQKKKKNDVFRNTAKGIFNRFFVHHFLFIFLSLICFATAKNWICGCQSFVADVVMKNVDIFIFCLFVSFNYRHKKKQILYVDRSFSSHLSQIFGMTRYATTNF